MKKIALCFIVFGLLVSSLFSQGWNKIFFEDSSFEIYSMNTTGNDSKNTYACAVWFVTNYEETESPLFLFMVGVKKNESIRNPCYNLINNKIPINIKNKNNVNSFSGQIFFSTEFSEFISMFYPDFHDWVLICIENKVQIKKLAALFRKNESFELSLDGKNGQIKTNIEGGLSFYHSEPLFLSKDKKILKCVKWWAKDSLENAVIPDGVTEIMVGAFSGCESLKSIDIPETVSEIGMMAFSGCSKLENITIPKSVKKLSQGLFSDCSALVSVTFLNDEIEIDDDDLFSGIFENCKSLKSINLKKFSLQNGFCIYNDEIISILDTRKTRYVIPKNIKSLSGFRLNSLLASEYEFEKNLTDLVIEKPTKIEDINFQNLYFYNLKSITVPKSVHLSHVPTTVKIIRN